MRQRFLPLTHLSLILSLGLIGCSPSNPPTVTNPDSSPSNSPTVTNPDSATKGQLILVANGEDFIRQGFVSKDGWQIDFDHAYVNLSSIKAYQTDPPFDPDSKAELKAKETAILLEKTQTVDLAAGDADADPIVVQEITAPVGSYNSLEWQVIKGNEGETDNATIVLIGKATKDGQTVDFTLNLQEELSYVCGEFIGDERKGYVTEEESTEIETTFHFDHLFGDAETPADDDLNVKALGFEPLANLAENGQLIIDQTTLEQKLSPTDTEKLQKALIGLGHVGEGHCRYEANS
ncbi:MAG: DUF4382 domain-containing protein [Microcystaceae cyanobacterium]